MNPYELIDQRDHLDEVPFHGCDACHEIHIKEQMIENMDGDCEKCENILIEGRLIEVYGGAS